MRRLIFARPKKLSFDKDFREIISSEEFSDFDIAQIIIKSNLFNKLINNKKLSNHQIFDKLILAKLGNIAKMILKKLLSSQELAKKIDIYNRNEVGKNIIQYIRNSLSNNESELYQEINVYIYNIFHKQEEQSKIISIDNIADLKEYLHNKRHIELSDLLRDIIESAIFNFICYTEDEVNVICETIKKSFIKYYPNGIISKNELSQFLRERTMSIEVFYFKHFQGNKLPIIKELIKDIYTYDEYVEIEYNNQLDKDLRLYMSHDLIYNTFINSCKNVLSSKFYLDRIGVKKLIDDKNNIKEKLSVKEVKLDNLRNMTLKQIKNLPTLSRLKNKTDNIGDQENISLSNFYQTKIIISSDGNIRQFSADSGIAYINELQNKQLNYAIGTIINNIVCIYKKNNISINDIINICKNDPEIDKVYELNEQVNFAAKIIRRAKLAKLIWKK